jgi:hypothetical protein
MIFMITIMITEKGVAEGSVSARAVAATRPGAEV